MQPQYCRGPYSDPSHLSEQEMALETLARNALIDRLGCYPPYSMIYIPDEPIKPAFLSRNLISSMGLLDTLPTELLHIILN